MVDFEQVQKLREYANISYEEAKKALEEANGDMLEAVISLEKQNRIKAPEAGGYYNSREEKTNGNGGYKSWGQKAHHAPEDVARIFDRFYRSDESRARKTGGSGLGLAIAKWIVEHHDGDYEVLSRVDIGTRVTLILPAAKAPSEAAEKYATPVSAGPF